MVIQLLFQAADMTSRGNPFLLQARVEGKHQYVVPLVRTVTLVNAHWGENVSQTGVQLLMKSGIWEKCFENLTGH